MHTTERNPGRDQHEELERSEATPRVSVLLAEDNDDNVRLVRAFLGDVHFAVTVAENGQRAVELFAAGRFDAVLMDVQMPVMHGLEAARRIRACEAADGRGRTLMLALTAHASSEDAARSVAAGCDGHLTKPVRRQTLLDSLAPARRR
jgi:CheY-like chemotaxis protein